MHIADYSAKPSDMTNFLCQKAICTFTADCYNAPKLETPNISSQYQQYKNMYMRKCLLYTLLCTVLL